MTTLNITVKIDDTRSNKVHFFRQNIHVLLAKKYVNIIQ